VKSVVHSYIDRMQHHSSRLTIGHSWDSTVYHSTPLTVNNKYHDVFGHWVHSLPTDFEVAIKIHRFACLYNYGLL